ncbi:DUF2306 domain-containing protein [Blastopirellula sp. JC732]|uniref:DUF2306 domain-containing protein n=1 Tax=Blastopirellula sediminis TaxID=2894196 RepID=A0A9X1SGV7_9BACT|nr:DUF2306 domain-containing protein [Blastopirellula sediminis]MCC9606917.1 DUF2306 domain-containing protein [Blastopirellula sediminis]MCC9629788.1 DUF2306 domain-containing protein [Blastopirellula sediminis]
MSTETATSNRRRQLHKLAALAIALLLAKVLLSIVWEYRRYFPPDFTSNFLAGRQDTFVGWYAVAFYVHLFAGPAALLLGAFLLFSGPRWRQHAAHRWAGRAQMVVLFGGLLPSGLVMSTQALTGAIAGWGFAALAIATGGSAAAALYYAVRRQIPAHRHWANRCLLLLISPLLFRVVNGLLYTLDQDTDQAYQINAWLSWLSLLAGYELWRLWTAPQNSSSLTPESTS